MRIRMQDFRPSLLWSSEHAITALFHTPRTAVLAPLAAILLAIPAPFAQTPDRILQPIDTESVQTLADHHPAWAVPANDAGAVPPDLAIESLTLVLARSPEQEQALDQLLKDQQDPNSPQYHHWLTATEMGERFGPSENDIAAIAEWLQSQGLHVNWVASSRILIGFGGTAGNLAGAFRTEFHYYKLNGRQRMSVSSDAMIPAALAPVIRAVRGLYTIEDRSYHRRAPGRWNAPSFTVSSDGETAYFIAPADFATIYDLPAGLTGSGMTIGIAGEARTDTADFAEFRALTAATFTNPTEVIPSSYGGADPGPAYTAPPSCETTDTCSQSISDLLDLQGEATLDVLRTGSVAPGASLLLVTASDASGGIADDAEYLVDTTPTPAQVMSISFGACEFEAGSGGVDFWDALFEQAAGEGISVFVSSGDSGASGCDDSFTTPPTDPAPNSPNYICSSSYATCVGGTEFNDTSDPAAYWSSTNNASTLASALSYIPEGAWNEPLDANGDTLAAASGGGVSQYIATPSWQSGTGVPTARTGRYTPDVSFSAAGHDGYFGCFAAAGASCVEGADGFEFEYFYGTSASAPSMAGVAALLDQQLGGGQGNLNPELYMMAASVPAAFHQVSIASSGVANCSVATPSMCNNSIPSPTAITGGQPGFSLGAAGGYSEATGLGSLDAGQFIAKYSNSSSKLTPAVTLSVPSQSITLSQSVLVLVTVNGASGNPAPTGSVTLTSGTFSASAALGSPSGASSSASLTIPAGSLAVGADTLVATYTATGSTYNNATGEASITVTPSGKTTPAISWPAPAAITYGTALSTTQLDATASVAGSFTYSPAAGAVLTAGQQTLTATFTPTDTTDYNNATATVTLTVNKATPSIVWATPAAIVYGTPLSATQLDATASAAGAFSYSPAAGATLSAGQQTLTASFTPTDTADYYYTAATVTLTVNKATPTITWPTPAAVSVGSTLSAVQLDATASVPGVFVYSPAAGMVLSTAGNTTLSVTFTPNDSTDYNSASTSVVLAVGAAVNPGFVVVGTNVSLAPGATTGNTSTITVTPSGGFAGSVTLTAAVTSSPAGAVDPPALSFGSSSPVSITGTSSATATLTISTTAATTGQARPQSPLFPWTSTGGAVLACVLLFWLPGRRRGWRNLIGMVALLAALTGGLLACSGGNTTTGGGGGGSGGTTPGSYTITVTGASGSGNESASITLTVT